MDNLKFLTGCPVDNKIFSSFKVTLLQNAFGQIKYNLH